MKHSMVTPAVFTLVYVSTMRRLLSRSELGDLLVECRDRNTTLDVSGLLIHHDGHVLQLLEGDKHVVRDLYRLITGDPRHHAVMTIWTNTADHRRFPGWTMAYEDFEDHDEATVGSDDPLADQTPELAAITSHGTVDQRQFVQRRDAALRHALGHGRQLLSTLAVLTHGHDPETVQKPDGTTYLQCRECRILADHDPTHPATKLYPCLIAVNALHALETGL